MHGLSHSRLINNKHFLSFANSNFLSFKIIVSQQCMYFLLFIVHKRYKATCLHTKGSKCIHYNLNPKVVIIKLMFLHKNGACGLVAMSL